MKIIFLFKFFQLKKKPKEWENVKINIFDSWHDDLIYETNFNSNYLWVRLKSKYGIGSITFIPNNFDKKHKDYIILHEYVNKKNFKPVILGNVKILPYSYHRCWDDGEMKYVYHAGGSTPTKFERIKNVLC